MTRKAKEKLIGKNERKAFRVERPRGTAQAVIVCDHASNKIPKKLGSLGLKKADLQKHIAWDPGTEQIGRWLGRAMDATTVLAGYSRLVADLNRGHDNKECMRATSDGIKIPGNEKLSAHEKKQRLEEIFWPYHDAIDRELDRFLKKKTVPVLISIHSFTPRMQGKARPWHIGVMWNREERIARKLAKALRAQNPKLVIGENKPYSLKSMSTGKDTIRRHAEDRGIPYIIVEFRQDLVGNKKSAEKFARIFYRALKEVLHDPNIYKRRKLR